MLLLYMLVRAFSLPIVRPLLYATELLYWNNNKVPLLVFQFNLYNFSFASFLLGPSSSKGRLPSVHFLLEGLYFCLFFEFCGWWTFSERWETCCSAWQATGMHCFGPGPAGESCSALGPSPSVTGHSPPWRWPFLWILHSALLALSGPTGDMVY